MVYYYYYYWKVTHNNLWVLNLWPYLHYIIEEKVSIELEPIGSLQPVTKTINLSFFLFFDKSIVTIIGEDELKHWFIM